MNRERKSVIKLCIGLFICYACLAWLFPYTGDDWAWGSSVGLERLATFFAGYNGRYAGNLLVLALTRSKLLDTVVMAASFLGVCLLSYEYTDDRSKGTLLLAAALFLLMPKGMWAQVVAWTAGFTNYVPSALITVAFLVSVREITDQKLSDRRETLGYSVWMTALGFVGALFVESITVFHICLAAAVIACMFLRFRKYRLIQVGFLLGSVAGAWVMFANGAYDRIAQGEDYYRHMPVGLRDTVYFAVEQAGKILDYILFDNLPFCILVSVLLLALAVWKIKTGEGKTGAVLPAIVHILCLVLLWKKDWAFTLLTSRIAMKQLVAGMIPVVIAVLYVLSIMVMVWFFVEKGRRFRMLLPLYCAVVSLAPLLVVDPIGPRCVFIGYFLMIVFTADLFGYVRRQVMPQERWLNRAMGLLVAAQLVFYVSVFYPIHYYDALRLDFIKEQAAQGKKEVLICALPNPDYLWDSTPVGGHLMERYKLFYGLDADLQFTCIPSSELEDLANGGS